MTDIVNDIYPIAQGEMPFVANGLDDTSVDLTEFSNGFFIWYIPINYTDGTYTLDIQESTDGGATGISVPSERLLFPEIVLEKGIDPLVITSGGFVDQGVARVISIKDVRTDALHINVVATGVTVGATILVATFAQSQRKPTTVRHVT